MTNPTDLDALLTDALSDDVLFQYREPLTLRDSILAAICPVVAARLHEAEQARDDWRLITDGAKHDPRCPFNETDVGPRQAWPCLRCQMQAAEAREAALREALTTTKRLAREATNGWACYAKRKIEHDDISRIHRALDHIEAPLTRSQP